MCEPKILTSIIDLNVQNNIFDISDKVENGSNEPDFTFPRWNIGKNGDY